MYCVYKHTRFNYQRQEKHIPVPYEKLLNQKSEKKCAWAAVMTGGVNRKSILMHLLLRQSNVKRQTQHFTVRTSRDTVGALSVDEIVQPRSKLRIYGDSNSSFSL